MFVGISIHVSDEEPYAVCDNPSLSVFAAPHLNKGAFPVRFSAHVYHFAGLSICVSASELYNDM